MTANAKKLAAFGATYGIQPTGLQRFLTRYDGVLEAAITESTPPTTPGIPTNVASRAL